MMRGWRRQQGFLCLLGKRSCAEYEATIAMEDVVEALMTMLAVAEAALQMNVEIGTEAAQFPEKEYINGIFHAVCGGSCSGSCCRGRGGGCGRAVEETVVELQRLRRTL
jgi:hypothetical protein